MLWSHEGHEAGGGKKAKTLETSQIRWVRRDEADKRCRLYTYHVSRTAITNAWWCCEVMRGMRLEEKKSENLGNKPNTMSETRRSRSKASTIYLPCPPNSNNECVSVLWSYEGPEARGWKKAKTLETSQIQWVRRNKTDKRHRLYTHHVPRTAITNVWPCWGVMRGMRPGGGKKRKP